MLLIDDLLMLPFSGFNFVMKTLRQVAEEQYTDDGSHQRAIAGAATQIGG